MAIAPRKDVATLDVKDCKNGTAELLVCQGQLEFGIRLDADQVDDLQSALETVSHELEEWHRADEISSYGDARRASNE